MLIYAAYQSSSIEAEKLEWLENFEALMTDIYTSWNEKLLGITTDNDLKLKDHIKTHVGKASAKICALSRITPYMDLPKRKQIMNTFFKSQFSYSPLTWMMHSRKFNNKINRLHKRCLRITYNDSLSSFEELLERDNCFSVQWKYPVSSH